MPELPEVESVRQLLLTVAKGKQLCDVTVLEDDKIFKGLSANEVKSTLEGATVCDVGRKGKYFWLDIKQSEKQAALTHILIHLGMAGHVVPCAQDTDQTISQYVRIKQSTEDWPPRFHKLLFTVKSHDGTAPPVRMAFCDSRRFGRVSVLEQHPTTVLPVSKLGFDVLTGMPDLETFTQLMMTRKVALKALLLDQGFSAGVGNYVADEILYQARIHPEVKPQDMVEEQIKAVYDATKYVIQTAVNAKANYQYFPESWLFHKRWTGKKTSSIDGNTISFIEVGSRTTAYVPSVQTKTLKGKSKASQQIPKSNVVFDDTAAIACSSDDTVSETKQESGSDSNKSKRKRRASPNKHSKKNVKQPKVYRKKSKVQTNNKVQSPKSQQNDMIVSRIQGSNDTVDHEPEKPTRNGRPNQRLRTKRSRALSTKILSTGQQSEGNQVLQDIQQMKSVTRKVKKGKQIPTATVKHEIEEGATQITEHKFNGHVSLSSRQGRGRSGKQQSNFDAENSSQNNLVNDCTAQISPAPLQARLTRSRSRQGWPTLENGQTENVTQIGGRANLSAIIKNQRASEASGMQRGGGMAQERYREMRSRAAVSARRNTTAHGILQNKGFGKGRPGNGAIKP